MILSCTALLIKIKNEYIKQYDNNKYVISLINYPYAISYASNLEDAISYANELLILSAWDEKDRKREKEDLNTIIVTKDIEAYVVATVKGIDVDHLEIKNSILVLLTVNTDDYIESFKVENNHVVSCIREKEEYLKNY